MERKGERVGAIVLLNDVYARLLQQSLTVKQVQVDDQSTPPSSYCSFVAYGGYDEPYAPAFSASLPLRAQVVASSGALETSSS